MISVDHGEEVVDGQVVLDGCDNLHDAHLGLIEGEHLVMVAELSVSPLENGLDAPSIIRVELASLLCLIQGHP